mgnify:CR=1 FL=1|tara:strand:+ start:1652 stop:1855 length:204 start_codon:yes stop_codon:yes gene_type:complete
MAQTLLGLSLLLKNISEREIEKNEILKNSKVSEFAFSDEEMPLKSIEAFFHEFKIKMDYVASQRGKN